MNGRAGLVLLLATLFLFVILNRTAYKGYFQDDDLNTLSWAQVIPGRVFLNGLLTPRIGPSNFRAVGAFYYHVIGTSFGLDFPKYLIPLQALHLLNICLLWLLLRKIGTGSVPASAGIFFFGLNAVVFDAWWKPMYVFDVLCGTFSLLTLLLYTYDRWILSLVAFWLAYKSKELAVMLPAVLACYELWLGKKRWRRLLPFVVISLSWGLQALIRNPGRGTPYELQLGLTAQMDTLRFYASRFLFLPYAGLLLLLLPVLIHDRRLWFGFAVTVLLMVPLLILPGRLFAVYWYVPLTGVAIMLATIADGRYRLAAALFLLLWIPWDFVNFRQQRRDNLRLEAQNRAYVTELARFAKLNPGQRLFIYDSTPDNFHWWGITGAVACVNKATGIRAQSIDDPRARDAIESGEAAWLHWSPTLARLEIAQYPKVRQPLAYVPMNLQTPPWQLLSGWYSLDEDFRWTQPDATTELLKPKNANGFEIAACVVPEQVRNHATVDLRVVLDGRPLGDHEFTAPGCEKLRWPVPRKPSGMAKIELHIAPPFHPTNGDTRVLGVTVRGLGFVSQ